MSCSQSRRGRAGAAGPAARVEPANERGSRVSTRRQARVRGAAPAARRRRRWAPCPATPASPAPATWRRPGAPVRGPRKNCRLAPTPSSTVASSASATSGVYCSRASAAPARRPRPADCAAAARPGARWRRRRRAHVHHRPQGARPGSGRSRAPAPARRTPGRRQASAGVWRPAAGSAGRRRSRGAWRAGVSKAPGSRPTQRRIAGRPRRLRIWTDSPARAPAPAAGGAWRGRRRRTDAGRRTQVAGLGRQMQPAQRFGADLGQPAEQGAAAAVPEDLLGGPERVRRFSGQTQSNCRGSSRQLIQLTILGACGAAPARSDAVSPAGTGPGAAGGSRPRRDAETAVRPGCPSASRHPAARPTAPHVRSAARRPARQLWRATRRDGCVRGLHGGVAEGAAGCCLLLYKYKGYLFSSSSPIDTVISSSNGIRLALPVFLLTTSPYVTGVTTACCSKR